MTMSIRKLPSKSIHIVMPLVISIFMTFTISLVSTSLTVGFNHKLLSVFPTTWGLSWLIGFPILLIVLPTAKRITSFIVRFE